MLHRALPLVALFGLVVVILVIDTEKDIQKNERTKEVIALGNRAVSVLEDRYNARAQAMADIPQEWRKSNWGGGSCVHATTISLLRWQGLFEIAAEYNSRYSGGEATAQSPHTAKMDAMGLKYVVTNGNDSDFDEFTDWALSTRRGFGVTYPRGHCVACIGRVTLDGCDYAVILDNNHTSKLDYHPYSQWIQTCKGLGGHAFAFTSGKIPPPRPTR